MSESTQKFEKEDQIQENHRRNVTQDIILKRYLLSIDSSYEYVVHRADNVHIYRFEENWVEMNIQGSLYIYKRSHDRGFRLIVFNRKGLNDFKLNIPNEFFLEFEKQFVIFSPTDKKNIFGFWFEQNQEAEDFYKNLKNCKDM